jgi:transcription antitermination factor NusG
VKSGSIEYFYQQDTNIDSVCGWTVIYTRPNHEKTVATALSQRSIHSYLPVYKERRKWSDRIKVIESVLFPNYVFAKLTPATRSEAIKTAGVAAIVSTGGRDDLVEDHELKAIQKVLEADLPVEPVADLVPGEPVVVECGPLAGIRGRYVERGRQGRIFVHVEMLRRGLSVPVDLSCIRPLRSALPSSLQNLARALRPRTTEQVRHF